MVSRQKWLDLTDKILGHDFLTPCLAEVFGPEVLRHLLPFRWFGVDQGRAVQNAFEEAVQQDTGSVGVAFGNLLSSYSTERGIDLPLLFFNSTDADSGNRVVLSPRCAAGDDFESYPVEPETLDVDTAAFTSARFPIITPVAYLRDTNGKEVALVDGGYFDNTGLWTLKQVLNNLKAYRKKAYREKALDIPFQIIVIRPRYYGRNDGEQQRPTFLQDYWPYLWAVEKARQQHAVLATLDRELEDPDRVLEVPFGFPKTARIRSPSSYDDQERGLDVPLGWSLSPRARKFLKGNLSKNMSGRYFPLAGLKQYFNPTSSSAVQHH
jgi:hypothetical protein